TLNTDPIHTSVSSKDLQHAIDRMQLEKRDSEVKRDQDGGHETTAQKLTRKSGESLAESAPDHARQQITNTAHQVMEEAWKQAKDAAAKAKRAQRRAKAERRRQRFEDSKNVRLNSIAKEKKKDKG